MEFAEKSAILGKHMRVRVSINQSFPLMDTDLHMGLGPPFFNDLPSSQLPLMSIEHLSLADVLKNPHVKTLYDNWERASGQVVSGQQIQNNLYNENTRLQAENERLKAGQGALTQYVIV